MGTREPIQLWMISKRKQGKYLNSPGYWKRCGYLRDDCPQNAVVRAMFIVGSSEVTIQPVWEWEEMEQE